MKRFLGTENYKIIPDCSETFTHSLIKHSDGFADHHYFAAWTGLSQLCFSNSETPLHTYSLYPNFNGLSIGLIPFNEEDP